MVEGNRHISRIAHHVDHMRIMRLKWFMTDQEESGRHARQAESDAPDGQNASPTLKVH